MVTADLSRRGDRDTLEATPACRLLFGCAFHPDLLCDTSLENRIETYPKRCRCRGALTEHEQQIITDNLREIGEELHHAIDRYSASIIASHIELLLNYCVRFCSQ